MAIELPDFRDSESLNRLRARMGAERLGYFEAFDPARHLTGEKRQELQRQGVFLDKARLYRLGDHTLAYRNSRVAFLVADQWHVTNCRELDQGARGLAASSDEAWRQYEETRGQSTRICARCLHDLRFQGVDLSKERRQHHTRDVLSRFTLAAFFAVYPDYPLYEQTHIRHVLDDQEPQPEALNPAKPLA